MELRFVNDRANPPILIKGLITKRTSEYSQNLFCDPADPEEIAFYDDDLTPIEKGHVYLWKLTENDHVQVSMPYRVMDAETATLVLGLASYRSQRPYIGRSIPQVLVAKPRSCLQNFSLSKTDFSIFNSRVEMLGGTVEKDEVDLGKLLSDQETLVLESEELIRKIHDMREERCSGTTDYKLDTQDKLDDALKEFAWFREQAEDIKRRSADLVRLTLALEKEVGRKTDSVRANSEAERVSQTVSRLTGINYTRFEREAIHRFRVDSKQESPTTKPAHVGTLQYEIGQLRQWFPALTKCSGYGEDLVINLTGIRIILTPDSVRVEGDPAALKLYTGSSGAVAKESVNQRRKRNISPRKKT
jgi:hypothetical protein